MMIHALADDTRTAWLAERPEWTFDPARNALYRRIRFRDFGSALAAMVRIGIEAEKADHHPEWSNVYDQLDIWLTTHDARGVSERDLALARRIDAIVGEAGSVLNNTAVESKP